MPAFTLLAQTLAQSGYLNLILNQVLNNTDNLTLLQGIVNTAQSIEVNRSKLISQTVSRDGRLLVNSRNWTNPYRFTIQPAPVYKVNAESRRILGEILDRDRYSEHIIQIGGKAGQSWTTEYLGTVPLDASGFLTNGGAGYITATAFDSTELDITGCSSITTGYILRAGDFVQLYDSTAGYGDRYVYNVRYDVVADGSDNKTVVLHRGRLAPPTGITFDPAGKRIRVGNYCKYHVVMTKLPNYRFLPGELLEFTDNFEMIENII